MGKRVGGIIIVDGMAKGKQRPRFSRKTHTVYTPSATTDFEKRVKQAWLDGYGDLKAHGEVMVSMQFYYPVPKSDSKKVRKAKLDEEIAPTIKPDIDNLIKSVLDGLNGVAFGDDKQVTSITAAKLYSEKAHTIVSVSWEDKT